MNAKAEPGRPVGRFQAVAVADYLPARHFRRAGLGDIRALAVSIADKGMLCAVLLAPDGRLIDGERRLLAAKMAGLERVPAYRAASFDDAVAYLRATWHEGTLLHSMLPVDRVLLGMRLEAVLEPETAARITEGQQWGAQVLNGQRAPGRVKSRDGRDRVGEAIGWGGSTYGRARYIVRAAEAAGPDSQQAAIMMEMQRTGVVTGPYMRLRALEQPAERASAPPSGLGGEPPSGTDKTPRAAAARRRWIRELARTGEGSLAIAERLGIDDATVRRIARKEGIDIPADRVSRRTRLNTPESNDVLARAVEDLDAIAWSLSQVQIGALDQDRSEEWATQLYTFARQAQRLARQIRERNDH